MTTIEVCRDGRVGTQLIGRASFTRNRGRVATTFVYDTKYLAGGGQNIDPELALSSGAQHRQGLLGAFADGAPDHWGRDLIEQAERLRAREEVRSPRGLDDVDFLLGVSDDMRQGALRFRVPGDPEFLGVPSRVPRLDSLPSLLRASDELASEGDSSAAVRQLLHTGATGLGGARPKASVRLDDGSLAIAKFPHGSDSWDVMAWEATALDLLQRAGIRVSQHRLARVGDRGVLILRRFDRSPTGDRIGYISAKTATGAADGEQRDYADIADAVRDLSLSPKRDLEELFRRVAASVALGNTDDHLRNHGFLADRGSWSLSPAFDVNPTPDLARARSTSIMGADGFPDEVEALFAFASECGLNKSQTFEQLGAVADGFEDWQQLARENGVSAREIVMMAESLERRRRAIAVAASRAD